MLSKKPIDNYSEVMQNIQAHANYVDVVKEITTDINEKGNKGIKAPCPKCHHHKPSMLVDSKRKSGWCYACKQSTSMFDFVKINLDISPVQSIRWIANLFQINVY